MMASWLSRSQTADSDAISVLSSAVSSSQTPEVRDTTEDDPLYTAESQDTPFKRRKLNPAFTPRNNRLWAETRRAKDEEPTHTRHKQKIWYCKRCTLYPGTPNAHNARTHLRREHGIILTDEPTKLQKEIDEQTRALFRDEDDKLDQPFENRMRNAVNSEAVNRALVNLVTRRNLPHNCVQWPELHTLIHCFNPAASRLLIRSHTTLRQRIELQYHIELSQLKEQLQQARSKIHFTTDTWTTPNHMELQAITGHFVNGDGQLKKALLSLPELTAGHSGSETSELFMELAEKLEIIHKIGYITSDNASCNDTMMASISEKLSELGVHWEATQHRTRCLGHCINLTAQAFVAAPNKEAVTIALETSQEPSELFMNSEPEGWATQQPLQTLRNFMKWCKDSISRYRQFRKLAKLAPVVSNETRWHSWFYMLTRGLETQAIIVEFMKAKDCPFVLTLDDWDLLRTTHTFLQPFHEVTQRCESDKVTLDAVLLHMDFLKDHLSEASTLHAADTALKAAITTAWFAFDKWYQATDNTPVYAAAVLLHPMRREQYLKDYWPDKWGAKAVRAARDLWIKDYKPTHVAEELHTITNDSISSLTRLERWQQQRMIHKRPPHEDEFTRFIKQPASAVTNPLQWWLEETQQKDYPNLSRMAIDILSVPPMSAESERIFSTSRRQISWGRSRLEADIIEFNECIKSWIINGIAQDVEIPDLESDIAFE